MNTISKCVAAVAMLTGSVLANAGTETLDYQGNLMTGSQTTWNGVSPVTSSTTGTYTAFIDLSSDGSGTWSPGLWGIDLNGSPVLSGNGYASGPPGETIANINLQSLNESVVGAAIDWSFTSTGPGSTTETISVGDSGGDSFLSHSGCDRSAPAGGGLCGTTLSNSTTGTWTVAATSAPEIDPGTAGSALTLLAGFAAMVRGRKR